jgi:hypothetical protein
MTAPYEKYGDMSHRLFVVMIIPKQSPPFPATSGCVN